MVSLSWLLNGCLEYCRRMELIFENRGIILNAFSLGFGFFGNFCLLLNFTKRVRYIIALPATIISWYFATGIVRTLFQSSWET